MMGRTSIRLSVLSFAATGALWAQVFSQPLAQKPSAAVPSSAPSSALPATSATTPASATPSQRSARRAEVSFAKGQLAVKADNSSLNLILREIGRQTGIKITGGVTEERVFGSYGPGSTAEVLNHLLDGTGSNVLLIASEAGTPGELILTPRMGGVTPPNPNAKGFDDDSDDEDAPRTVVPRGVTLFGGAQPSEPAPQPASTAATPATPPPVVPAGVGDPSNTTVNPQSPNGVKTPQEIYQQLQMLRQQQQQAQPPQ